VLSYKRRVIPRIISHVESCGMSRGWKWLTSQVGGKPLVVMVEFAGRGVGVPAGTFVWLSCVDGGV
jgi:hypothetical protein